MPPHLENTSSYTEMSTEGKVIKCRAAIAWEKDKPLSIEQVEVGPPQKGEVRIKICYTAICHTDLFALEGNCVRFPTILGHEAAGIVESVGPDVKTAAPGDHVIPSLVPQCRKCKMCLNPRTNCCEERPFGTVKGELMDDGTSRFSCDGKQIFHFAGVSSFSEYTVVREIAVCKINPKAPLNIVCLIGCGVCTGFGAPVNACAVTSGSTAAVWGLGAIGMSVVLGCKSQGAARIVGIDFCDKRLQAALELGATDIINPKKLPEGKNIQEYIRENFNGGFDFTFEATGKPAAMFDAVECAQPCVGQTCIIGCSAEKLTLPSMDLLYGRSIRGCYLGGYKTRDGMPMLVEKYMEGKLPLEKFISWRFPLDEINKGVEHLYKSEGIRSVIGLCEC